MKTWSGNETTSSLRFRYYCPHHMTKHPIHGSYLLSPMHSPSLFVSVHPSCLPCIPLPPMHFPPLAHASLTHFILHAPPSFLPLSTLPLCLNTSFLSAMHPLSLSLDTSLLSAMHPPLPLSQHILLVCHA